MSRGYYRVEVVSRAAREIPRAQLRRYERLGLVSPTGEPEGSPRHRAGTPREDLLRLRRIRRLQRDLGLDLAGVEVVVRLLDQIADLQKRLGEPR